MKLSTDPVHQAAPAPVPPAENHRTIVGRRRRAKTEARIIEAALHVFAEKGPQAAVIDDFITAAGIARGTFYNYFRSTEELLDATKTSLRDELMQSIEEVLAKVEDPVTRIGLGIRLYMSRAEADKTWCAFVASVRLAGTIALEAPIRDLKRAIKSKEVSVPSVEIALDLFEGVGTSAMRRLISGKAPKKYGQSVAIVVLQGLGVAPSKIAEIMKTKLPELRSARRKIEQEAL